MDYFSFGAVFGMVEFSPLGGMGASLDLSQLLLPILKKKNKKKKKLVWVG